MFCSECGKEVDNQVKFCPYCGHLKEVANSSDSVSIIRPANKRNLVIPVVALIGALLLSIVIVRFALQNVAPVAFSFNSSRFEASLGIVILGGFVLGAFAGVLAGMFVSFLRS